MVSIGNALKLEVERSAAELARHNPLFVAGERGALTRLQVRAYLDGVHFMLRHTDGFLKHAADRAAALGDHALAEHYRLKRRDEAGHERWAEEDLRALATPPDDDDRATPVLAKLVTYLHEVIERDPCLFLSYILLVEYLTVLMGPRWLEALESRCGVTAKVTAVANHVELDRAHVSEGVEEIDRLVVADRRAEMVSVMHTSLAFIEASWSAIVWTGTKAA